MQNKKAHYSWLDLVRFIAALMVVCFHARAASFVEYGLLPDNQHNVLIFGFFVVSRLGYEAVLAFFVLSGFLVGGKVIQQIKEGTFDLKSYTIDRTVRIMLPLISALLLIICINFITGKPNNLFVIFGNLFSLQGIFVGTATEPLWSLSYEVWFYVLMGAVAYLITKQKYAYHKTKYNSIITCLIILSVFMIFTKLEAVYLFVWLFGSLSIFYTPQKNKFVLIISIFLIIVSAILLQFTAGTHSFNFSFLNLLPNRDVIVLMFALLMSIMIQQLLLFKPQKPFAVKIDKIGTHWAKFSYTLYLTHFPILNLLNYLGFPKSESVHTISLAYYIVNVIICLLSAYFIYLLFEKHTFAVKKYLKAL